MNKLTKLIEQITAFGVNPRVDHKDKIFVLRKLLVELYLEFIKLELKLFKSEDVEVPEFSINEVYENVKSNFPDFGFYSSILDSNKMYPNVEIGVGDELDDLTDIIKDLLEVKWLMNNSTEHNAIWNFIFLMKNHSEVHLLNLILRLKVRNT